MLAIHPYTVTVRKRLAPPLAAARGGAASGKTFDSINPSTGETLAAVAEGDAEDINRTVAAARRAFEGPWSTFKPYEQQQVLLKLADLVEKHFDELLPPSNQRGRLAPVQTREAVTAEAMASTLVARR